MNVYLKLFRICKSLLHKRKILLSYYESRSYDVVEFVNTFHILVKLFNNVVEINFEIALKDREQGQKREILYIQTLEPRCESVEKQKKMRFYCEMSSVR